MATADRVISDYCKSFGMADGHQSGTVIESVVSQDWRPRTNLEVRAGRPPQDMFEIPIVVPVGWPFFKCFAENQ